jgi:RNA polymerase sigma factor (sigma-70 family)
MVTGSHHRARLLTLVSGAAPNPQKELPMPEGGAGTARARGVDWSILMAHAQSGDQGAYRRLLEEIAPYVRSLAVKYHRDPGDIEDSVQDVLLTVHAIRDTYDPTRPFGPWLAAIANRRIIDRLRRWRRSTARETALTDEHDTFAAPEANYQGMLSDERALREAIERLPQGQRYAIRLLKLQEMSLTEAAAASGMSVAALKVATHRAMKKLRKMFMKPGGNG